VICGPSRGTEAELEILTDLPLTNGVLSLDDGGSSPSQWKRGCRKRVSRLYQSGEGWLVPLVARDKEQSCDFPKTISSKRAR